MGNLLGTATAQESSPWTSPFFSIEHQYKAYTTRFLRSYYGSVYRHGVEQTDTVVYTITASIPPPRNDVEVMMSMIGCRVVRRKSDRIIIDDSPCEVQRAFIDGSKPHHKVLYSELSAAEHKAVEWMRSVAENGETIISRQQSRFGTKPNLAQELFEQVSL